MIQIQITGLKEIQRFLTNLPKNIQKEIGERGINEIAMSLQRKIKYRYQQAGYGQVGVSSGFGMRSITREENIITILAPYLAMIESGVSSHWVSKNIIAQHLASPGSTAGLTAKQMELLPYKGPPVYWYYKGPFVAPAIESFMKDLPRILERQLNKAIQKSK